METKDAATFEGKTVCWTPQMLARFKTFIKRTPANATTFTFDGNLYDKRYAKYLAEYLDGIFARKGTKPSDEDRIAQGNPEELT